MKAFRISLITLVPALLSGCATFGEMFSNDIACSLGEQKAFFISSYGPLGISSEIKQKTSEAVCKKEPPAPAAK